MPQVGDISTYPQIDGVKLFVETTGEEVDLVSPATFQLVPPGEDTSFKRITFTSVPSGTYRMNLMYGATAAVIGLKAIFDTTTWKLVESSSVIVLPSGTNPTNRDSCSNDLTLYVGENITLVVPITDANGADVDLTGKTIYFVCESRSGVKILINPITFSGNDVNIPTATLTLEEEDYEYAIREVSTEALLGSGLLKVSDKPKA